MFYLTRFFFFLILFNCFNIFCEETKIYLVRHGQTEWNVEGKMQGRANIPLNAVGKEQVKEAITKFQDICFNAAYSSGLSRAHETAEILVKNRHLPVVIDNRFEEVSFGKWEGKLQEDFIAAKAEDKQDVETIPVVIKRVMEGLKDVASKNPGGNILVVSHGGIIKYLITDAYGIPPEKTRVRNLDYIVLTECNGKWSMSHIDQMLKDNPQPLMNGQPKLTQ